MDQQLLSQQVIQFRYSPYSHETDIAKIKQTLSQLSKQVKYSFNLNQCDLRTLHQIFEIAQKTTKQSLVELNMSQTQQISSCFNLIMKSNLPNLKTIIINQFYGGILNNHNLQALSMANLPLLQQLTLASCGIRTQGIQSILKCNWPKLKHLSLGLHGNVVNLLKNIGMGKWTELEFLKFRNFIPKQTDDLDILPELFHFPKLKTLIFQNSKISDELLSKIKKQNFPILENLFLQSTLISGHKLFDLEFNLGWKQLKQLSLGSQNIIKENAVHGFSNICQYNFTQINKLTLDQFYLCKKATRFLTKANWNFLSHLTLKKCNLGQQDLKIITKCNWKSLVMINFNNNHFFDNGIQILSKGNWTNLAKLNIRKTQKTQFGVLNIKKTNSTNLKNFEVLEQDNDFQAIIKLLFNDQLDQ